MKPVGGNAGHGPARAASAVHMVAAALHGDAGARDFVVEQLACVPAMVRIKNHRMGAPLSSHELDDVVQDVLVAVWRKLGQWDGRVPLEHWAYGFVVVELLKTVERRSRRRAVVQVRQAEEPHCPEAARADAEADAELVEQAVGRLDPADREILRLKHHEDLTFEEIGARMGMPTNTAKTRYYRCIKRLRVGLAPAQPSAAREVER